MKFPNIFEAWSKKQPSAPREKKSYVNATSQKIGIFWNVLKRWQGSVYKLLYADLLIYLLVYYIIRCIYIFALNDTSKPYFEDILTYCQNYEKFFPIFFVLGFFVSTIMTRWWNQFTSIPRPTGLAVLLSANLTGNDEVGKALRRTIMRYVNCAITMVLRQLSETVMNRFPNYSNLVDAGLLNKNELRIINEMNVQYPGHSTWVLPFIWACTIVSKAREVGRIKNDHACNAVIAEIDRLRSNGLTLINYHVVNISLVYSQVVTIACYAYFLAAIFGSQTAENKLKYKVIDFENFPIFLMLQFLFYMGWLKVAEETINPFGEDDDDFDVNAMIDSNLQMSFLIVDRMFDEHPAIIKDCYWGDVPSELKDSLEYNNEDGSRNFNPMTGVQIHNGICAITDPGTPSVADMPETLKGIHRADSVKYTSHEEQIKFQKDDDSDWSESPLLSDNTTKSQVSGGKSEPNQKDASKE